MVNIIEIFFKRTFENEINEKLLYRNYVLETSAIKDYIDSILQKPYLCFINYIVNNYNVTYLSAEDVLQYSCFLDATLNICSVIRAHNDEGFKALQLGKFLEDDGKVRKDTAYVKYGENHVKTAESLGLVFNLSNVYFLSCIGYLFIELSKEEQNQLLARLILRNHLVQRLIYRAVSEKSSSYMKEVNFLTEKTAKRRKSNIRYLFNYISNLYPTDTLFFSYINF